MAELGHSFPPESKQCECPCSKPRNIIVANAHTTPWMQQFLSFQTLEDVTLVPVVAEVVCLISWILPVQDFWTGIRGFARQCKMTLEIPAPNKDRWMYDRYQKVKFCADIYQDVSIGLDIFFLLSPCLHFIFMLSWFCSSHLQAHLLFWPSLSTSSPLCVPIS